jgi:hypothetical protein
VPPRVRHTGKGSVSARTVTKHEVFDEAQLPREYLTKDPGAIKRAIDDGVESIPGVRIWKEKVAHVR